MQNSLPAVVLLVVDRPEGQGYGSGSLLDDEGRVLTNLHVVQGATSLRALLWEPDRPSWSAMDGGLSRFLFENEGQMKDVRLLQGDPQLDLAVVQVDGPLGTAHPLPERDSPLKVGERVYALGHPQQSVWSFTAGVVGAMPEGVIQHDAAINQGSSGGPLVDAWGRLVGVNSAKLLGGTEGIGYARPLSTARLLYDQSARPVGLDRSRPGTALLSCEHALDQSPRLADDCLVWESARPFGLRILTAASDLLLLPPENAKKIEDWFTNGGGDAWVAHTRANVLYHLGGEQGEPPERLRMPRPWADDPSRLRWAERPDVQQRLKEESEAIDRELQKHEKRLREVNGAAADYT
ncbi:MAG TPA: trypsin-like peptidase domain-containing protein, partial [Myxococcota bacterium]|nr:trypsin-like peptidase domain-containing protein [Myxococcota bacterium]